MTSWHIVELMCSGNQNTLYNASIDIVDNEQGLRLSHLKSIETLVIIPSLNHYLIQDIKSTWNFPACQWTLSMNLVPHVIGEETMCSLSLFTYFYGAAEWEADRCQQEGCGFHQSCICLSAWPVPPCLGATEKTYAWRETGRQVSLLNSDESSPAERVGGKTEAPENYWDEMVSSTVERQLCSLCSISVKNMWLGNNGEEQIE